MEIPLISKRQFNRFRKHLPASSNAEKIHPRTVLSCVIWVIKGGHSWSEIPAIYGNFDTIRKHFARWSKAGIFRKVFSALTARVKKSTPAMIDSTIVKAHRMASSMLTDKLPREIGRSVGSLITKIHLMATIEQIPLDFPLTGGQVNDSKEGEEIIKKNCPRFKPCWQTRDTIQIKSGRA